MNPRAKTAKSKSDPSTADRLPSNAELLHELRLHGAKAPRPRELPAVSRRTRDFLLTAGLASAVILLAAFKILGDSDKIVVLRLAFTAIALFCSMLWYIFYGIMGRY